MQDVNKVILIGRLGVDAIEKQTKNGEMLSFTLATNSFVQGKKISQWHRIAHFGTYPNKDYLKKGSLCCIEGSIRYSQYEKNGQRSENTQIIAQRIEVLSRSVSENEERSQDMSLGKRAKAA